MDSIVEFLNTGAGLFTILFLVIWMIVWKGLALWRSAQRKDVGWFIVFLLFNTVGILEIIYYFLIAKKRKS
jgi:hypothetical protein